MSTRNTLIGIVRQWAEHFGAAPETPEAVTDAFAAEVRTETRRDMARYVREAMVTDAANEAEEHVNDVLARLAHEIQQGAL